MYSPASSSSTHVLDDGKVAAVIVLATIRWSMRRPVGRRWRQLHGTHVVLAALRLTVSRLVLAQDHCLQSRIQIQSFAAACPVRLWIVHVARVATPIRPVPLASAGRRCSGRIVGDAVQVRIRRRLLGLSPVMVGRVLVHLVAG